MAQKFDVIVVGAGPAGLTAAYCLARKGFNVVVVERGEEVGSKNLYGGKIYSHVLNKVFLDFRKEAPIERWVRKKILTFMTRDDAVSITFESAKRSSYEGFTAYLTPFVKYLARRAEEAGAYVLTGSKADKLVERNGKFSSVIIDGDEISADVIVDAEGVNRILLERAGLANKLELKFTAICAREVIRLTSKDIEDRFNLSEDEGVEQLIIGYPTRGFRGGAFLYTNEETVTLGVVAYLDSLMKAKLPIYDLVEDIRLHPLIKNILKGGSVIEYGAHLVFEGGIEHLPKIYANGLLVIGDAAGFCLSTGLVMRGVDFAIESGYLASEAIDMAHGEGKYDEETLGSYYTKLLNRSFIFRELRAFRKSSRYLCNERLYRTYPDVLCQFFEELYTVDGTARKIYPTLRRILKRNRVSIFSLIRDVFGIRHL